MEATERIMTRMHYRLSAVATWARLFSWVVLAAFLLSPIGIYHQQQVLNIHVFNRQYTFVELLRDNPVLAMNMALGLASPILKGVVYWLLLNAAALGLEMIIETDLNFREKSEVLR